MNQLATGAVAMVIVLVGGFWFLSRSYYVGFDEQLVVIYQGVPASLGPLELSWVIEETPLGAEDLPEFYQSQLEKGIPAVDRHDARRVIDSLPAAVESEEPMQS